MTCVVERFLETVVEKSMGGASLVSGAHAGNFLLSSGSDCEKPCWGGVDKCGGSSQGSCSSGPTGSGQCNCVGGWYGGWYGLGCNEDDFCDADRYKRAYSLCLSAVGFASQQPSPGTTMLHLEPNLWDCEAWTLLFSALSVYQNPAALGGCNIQV